MLEQEVDENNRKRKSMAKSWRCLHPVVDPERLMMMSPVVDQSSLSECTFRKRCDHCDRGQTFTPCIGRGIPAIKFR
ncbi:unnamed protein product [Soboliphyme baturini]|uniref:Uncharacterized protein n=1 Tax=Soboliphyme baturini TaxID=241478 RepID=A0A183IB44_9BILA|nr:unnamed protein product [Soboliphyme baturini]